MKKTIIYVLAIIYTVCVFLFGFTLNRSKETIQPFYGGHYVDVNDNHVYFNLRLEDNSIEFYNGDYFQSQFQLLKENILVTEIKPLGKCILVAQQHDIHCIVLNNESYNIVTFIFKGNEYIKIEHNS